MRNKKNSLKYKGGAADPSSYSDAQSYMRATVGSPNTQYNNVFSNSAVGHPASISTLDGQKAGRGRTRRQKKGGLWGNVINQAVVPFGILAMQQTYGRKRNSITSLKTKSKFRPKRRNSRTKRFRRR
jgi:hypothetical protein